MTELKGVRINIKKPFPFTSTTNVRRWCPNECGKKVYYCGVNVANDNQRFYFHCPECERYFTRKELGNNVRMCKMNKRK